MWGFGFFGVEGPGSTGLRGWGFGFRLWGLRFCESIGSVMIWTLFAEGRRLYSDACAGFAL